MANRNFETVMLERLAECHVEACEEVLASIKAGRSLNDAVLDAIEALPSNKTRGLRRWLEDWESWEEWQEYERAGWRVEKTSWTCGEKGPHPSHSGLS